MNPTDPAESPKTASQIVATLALSKAQPSTAARPAGNESKRRSWLAKWIPLQVVHHQLQQALNQTYDLCCDYARNPAVGRTVVIFGENGCGKTSIAKAIYRWARAIKFKLPAVKSPIRDEFGPASAEFTNWAEIVDGFKPPANNYEILDDLSDSSLLVIDDIGAEHDPSSIGVEKLYVMLNRREHRWNIFTTNLPPNQWAAKWERRVSSRLYRNAQHIDLSQVPDYNS